MIRASGTRLLLRHPSLRGSHPPLVGFSYRRSSHTDSNAVDEWYIPIQLKPPAPQASPQSDTLTDETLIRLHRLSALEPPEQGSAEFEHLKDSLRSMLGMVDSVKEFEPVDDLKAQTTEQCHIPDGRIWPTDESLPVDWEALVRTQEDFLKSRQRNIPGFRRPNHSPAHPGDTSPPTSDPNCEYLALDMAIEGVHTVRRRGLGQQPQTESVFYVAKTRRMLSKK